MSLNRYRSKAKFKRSQRRTALKEKRFERSQKKIWDVIAVETALLQQPSSQAGSSEEINEEALEKVLAKTLGTSLASIVIGTPSPSVTQVGSKLLIDTETWLTKYLPEE